MDCDRKTDIEGGAKYLFRPSLLSNEAARASNPRSVGYRMLAGCGWHTGSIFARLRGWCTARLTLALRSSRLMARAPPGAINEPLLASARHAFDFAFQQECFLKRRHFRSIYQFDRTPTASISGSGATIVESNTLIEICRLPRVERVIGTTEDVDGEWIRPRVHGGDTFRRVGCDV